MKFIELLGYFDFSYDKDEKGYLFIDLQEAYLGNIVEERYTKPLDMVERLFDSIYGDDYIFSNEEEFDNCETHEEVIEKFGNDKECFPYLYYCLHPTELEDIPPTLTNVKEV